MLTGKSPKYCFEINGLPDDSKFNGMIFGRQIEHFKEIEKFKQRAKKNQFSAKGIKVSTGFTRFRKLYDVDEYFYIDRSGPMWHDDSVEVWYTKKEVYNGPQ